MGNTVNHIGVLMSLGYAAIKQDGVGIALFTDLGNFAFAAHDPLYHHVVEAVEAQKSLTDFDYLLNDPVSAVTD
jgi:hypothetical protein